MDVIPADVVADDIYVALLASAKRLRTVYSQKAIALETRAPQAYSQLFPHKFRKSNAFLRESLRFLYALPFMGSFCKMMLVTRVAQQTLLPWLGFFWLLLTGVLLTVFRYDIVLMDIALLLILLFVTNRAIATVRLPGPKKTYSPWAIIKAYVLTNVVMLTTGVTYPFFRQGSSYTRWGE
jgi:hypothetical protein